MKVKSKSEVTQSQIMILFSSSVMSDSLRPHGLQHTTPGSSFHGIFQARVLEWGAKEMSYQDTKRAWRAAVYGVVQRIK